MLNAGVVFGYASLNYVLNSLHRGGCVSGIFSFYFYLAVSSSRFSKFLFPWQLVVETPLHDPKALPRSEDNDEHLLLTWNESWADRATANGVTA